MPRTRKIINRGHFSERVDAAMSGLRGHPSSRIRRIYHHALHDALAADAGVIDCSCSSFGIIETRWRQYDMRCAIAPSSNALSSPHTGSLRIRGNYGIEDELVR